MTVLFNIIYLILAILYLPALILKGKHRVGFLQRFGIYSPALRQRMGKEEFSIWLHAVSVGEIKAAAPLIKRLREKNPGLKLIISTITPTGNKIAQAIAGEEDLVIYFPFDLSWIINRVFFLLAPKLLLIMETELWPNAIRLAKKNNIKTVIINGRISNKAFPRYKMAGFLFRPIIKKIDLLCMQTNLDAQRIVELGADKQSVHIVGNIKFDQIAEIDKHALPDIGLNKSERLILAGSTHDNEEQQIVKVFKKLKQQFPDIRLMIAPRHPQRVNQILEMLRAEGVSATLISQIEKKELGEIKNKVLILDIMGVLTDYYQLADIVFVGGSLVKHGGQNPIEPAMLGKPIVFGQYMFNFTEVVKLFLDNNAAVLVNDSEQLFTSLRDLLMNKAKIDSLVSNANKVIGQNRGSVARVITLVSALS
ncbi:MAG: 3-deoxy-D-manno-octulosonic acid transferase [Candidatus Omnitrophica bacterium]|nr:3-deoxy-D-manno-octulosonic acid transferase [Candidatus Omnitrophota bacterium]